MAKWLKLYIMLCKYFPPHLTHITALYVVKVGCYKLLRNVEMYYLQQTI